MSDPSTETEANPSSNAVSPTTEEPTEPQSPLTKQFTEPEWEALKAFRVSCPYDVLSQHMHQPALQAELPQILADSYPDNPSAKDTAITLWGVRIDPLNPKDARVSVVLMKFLRARYDHIAVIRCSRDRFPLIRSLSLRDAREMLVSTLRWRDSFKIDSILEEEFPQDIFGHVGYVQGRDKEGRPVVYVSSRRCDVISSIHHGHPFQVQFLRGAKRQAGLRGCPEIHSVKSRTN